MNSQIVFSTIYSPILKLDWNYDIYLPANYNSHISSSLLVMLHGLYGNHSNLIEKIKSKQILDKLLQYTDTQIVVLFIDGFNSFYINSKYGIQMENAIMQDLLPFICKKYNITYQNKHAIGGISMGGYGAARLALKYHDFFKFTYLVSPAIWSIKHINQEIYSNIHVFKDSKTHWSKKIYDKLLPQNYLNLKNEDIKFFIETSSKDKIVNIQDIKDFSQQIKSNSNDLVFIQDSFGGHNWLYWNKAVKNLYHQAVQDLSDQNGKG